MDDQFNMSMRKFLKQVGVTSQQEIEKAMREKGAETAGKTYEARVTVTVDGLDLDHVITGKIKGRNPEEE